MVTVLHGLTWDHERGLGSLVQASQAFSSQNPGVTVSWSARSLAEFEDVPLQVLAPRYDIITIDHPHVGKADADGCLVPLDELLAEEVLAEQASHSVGPSFASYSWNKHQWALAVDAAAQVSAFRPDLLAADGLDAPSRLEDLADFAASLSGPGVAIPANPTHLYSSFLSLCQLNSSETARSEDLRPVWWPKQGLDFEVAVPALEALYEILDLATPGSLEQGPIEVLDQMTSGDDVAYVPFVFGYANYSRFGSVPSRVEFRNVPTLEGREPSGLLGGAGIAVSAHCRHRKEAAEFVSYVTSEACQRGPYFSGGGQPGHRLAWLDKEINRATCSFFSSTLQTLDNACVRPRSANYPAFQRQAGPLLHKLVARLEGPRHTIEVLNELWRTVAAKDFALEPWS